MNIENNEDVPASNTEKDKRKGNSGRKKSDDPKLQCQFYINRSVVNGMGGMKKLRAFVLRTTAEEAKQRILKKQAKQAKQ
jgi:hypothetical protein